MESIVTTGSRVMCCSHCACCRNAINVGKSSSPTTPSTTVAPVERASVTPAPQKPGRSRRGAGASHLSEFATPVSTTGESQLVCKLAPHFEFNSFRPFCAETLLHKSLLMFDFLDVILV